jgi:hypothetical protein
MKMPCTWRAHIHDIVSNRWKQNVTQFYLRAHVPWRGDSWIKKRRKWMSKFTQSSLHQLLQLWFTNAIATFPLLWYRIHLMEGRRKTNVPIRCILWIQHWGIYMPLFSGCPAFPARCLPTRPNKEGALNSTDLDKWERTRSTGCLPLCALTDNL